MNDLQDNIVTRLRKTTQDFFATFSQSTADTFSWLAIIVFNFATIPSLLAVKTGLSDRLPPLELTLLVWLGLLLYFVRSAILKDMLMIITIGFGFAIQAILLGIIFFL